MDLKKTIVDGNIALFLQYIKQAPSVNMKDAHDSDNTYELPSFFQSYLEKVWEIRTKLTNNRLLHFAVLHKQEKIIQYLIENKARQYENGLGQTPASLAYNAQKTDSSFFSIYQYLQYYLEVQNSIPR